MKAKKQFCPNQACAYHGQMGKGNIVIFSRKQKRYQCNHCSKTFTASKNTIFYRLRTKRQKVLQAIHLLLEGNGVRAAARVLGIKPNTLQNWFRRACQHAEAVNHYLMKDIGLTQAQVDELWTFVKKSKSGSTPRRMIRTRSVTLGSGNA